MGVVGDGRNGLGGIALGADEVGLTGHDGLSLQVQSHALLTGLQFLCGVLLDTFDEVLTGARVPNVFGPDADALLDVAVADDLVEEDTDRGLGNVVDDTGLAVVKLIGHTVLLSQQFTFHNIPSYKSSSLGVSRTRRRDY